MSDALEAILVGAASLAWNDCNNPRNRDPRRAMKRTALDLFFRWQCGVLVGGGN